MLLRENSWNTENPPEVPPCPRGDAPNKASRKVVRSAGSKAATEQGGARTDDRASCNLVSGFQTVNSRSVESVTSPLGPGGLQGGFLLTHINTHTPKKPLAQSLCAEMPSA